MKRHASLSLVLAFGAVACSGAPELLDEDSLDRNAQAASAQGSGAYAQIASFGQNPGALNFYLYTPSGLDATQGAPVVFVLHGCTQQASDARNFGWEKIADAQRFYVAYPEQPSANNPVKCFNWAGEYGDTANLTRGQGENQSVASMVDFLRTNKKIDPKRVFVAGFSAGGAMVPVLLATWPDLFAAGAVNSGLPYRCATTVNDAYSCQNKGRDRAPAEWGNDVRQAFSGFTGPYPRVTIWHGTADTVVVPKNQGSTRDQWTNVHGISQTPSEQDSINGNPRARYRKNGEIVVETVTLTGMAHGVAVDPKNGCGTAGSYILDRGVCAAQQQADFFFARTGNPPPPNNQPPTVAFDSPAEGAQVSGTVVVSGRASDPDDGVAAVELRVDGNVRATVQNPGATFQINWNSAAEASGARQLTLKATDRAGQSTLATLNVRIAGGSGPDESASGTCTQHYVAGRFNVNGRADTTRYLACGRCNGYINAVTLYRFGTRWTDSATGTGCMDR